LQITPGTAADLKLVRIPLVSRDAEIALSELAGELGLPQPKIAPGSVDDLYATENKMLQSQRVIALLHLRTASAFSGTVRNWNTARDGSWPLTSVWLGAEKP
jgi:hypothetical protein